MGYSSEKNRVFLIWVFLIGCFVKVNAQNDAVSIRCVAVDSAGDVTLTWALPSNLNSWQSYQIFEVNNVNSLAGLTNPNQTSYTIPAASLLPASANKGIVSFYIATFNSSNVDYNSNIVSSIYLQLTNNNGLAFLQWNPISTPLPQGSSKWYKIWREYNNVWSLIDSTQNIEYTDTVKYCDTTNLSYQIQIADSTICVSTSNIVNGKFALEFNPPISIFDSVSVTPGGGVDISWVKSPWDNVIGYIIYKVISGNHVPIDTVYGLNNDSLINYFGGGNPNDSDLIFAVAAIDSCGNNGAISKPAGNTIFLKVKPNTCAQNNTLSWNPYAYFLGDSVNNGIGGYKVYYSVNHGQFKLLASLGPNARSYVDTNLVTREYRSYFIQAYSSAHPDTTSSSNVVGDSIKPPPLPRNNYLRVASVILNTPSVLVVGYIDSLSGAEYYEFQRSIDSTGGFKTIYTINAPHHSDSISYIDNSASPAIRSYHYQIITLDSCSKPIDSTNIGQTMLLTTVGQPNGTNILTWNDYRNWFEGPAYYMIYRSVDGINYTLLPPNVTYTDAGKNTYTDNISGITEGQGTFYYYVKAVEDSITGLYPYHFIDTSYSNVAEAYQDPTVFIPNAFCPTGKNKIFKPVGVFINVQSYDLSIYNRWGQLIFESNDPDVGWDGSDKGSNRIVQQDVYAYLLTYTSSKGEYFQRKGTVTLLK